MFQRGEFPEADAGEQFGPYPGEVSAAGEAFLQQGGEGAAEDAGEQDGEEAEQLQRAEAGRRAAQAILAAAPLPPGQDLRLKALAALEKDYEPPRPGRRSKGGRRGREKERPGKGGGALPSITLARE